MPAFLITDNEDEPKRVQTDKPNGNEEKDRRLERIETETTALGRKVEWIAGKIPSFQSMVVVVAIVYLAFSLFKAFTGGK